MLVDAPARLSLPGWIVRSVLCRGLDECSLVIATYRRAASVVRLLRSIVELSAFPAEVIICDGSPDSNTECAVRDFVAKQDLGFDLVYVRCPAGLTRQRNIGVDISSRNLVFFLDDDAQPLDGYFSEIYAVFANDLKRVIGAVGGSVINEMNRPLNRRWRVRLRIGLAPRVSPLSYHTCGMSNPRALMKPFRGVLPANVLPGCAFAFRREVFETDRFSTFFYGYAQGEDLEMALRVARKWRVVSCGDAHVLHLHEPAGRPPSFDKGKMEVSNRHFIWKRYVPQPALSDRVRFWADICFLILIDLARYIARPWKPGPLAHAAGLLCGGAQAIFRSHYPGEPAKYPKYTLEDRVPVLARGS